MTLECFHFQCRLHLRHHLTQGFGEVHQTQRCLSHQVSRCRQQHRRRNLTTNRQDQGRHQVH